jgi:protein TonB
MPAAEPSVRVLSLKREEQREEPREAATVAYMPRPALTPIERHGYQASPRSRLFGGAGTIAICSLLAAAALFGLRQYAHPVPAPRMLVVSSVPAASPPKPAPRPPEQPRTVAKPAPMVEPRIVAPQPLIPLATASASPPTAVPVPDPAPPAPSAPPVAQAAEAAPPPAVRGPDTWEGRLIGRLQRYSRDLAWRTREHGTVMLRFRINRDGHVLSASVERSSGSAALDAAVLKGLHLADPLPRIPADRPDVMDLVVPVVTR